MKRLITKLRPIILFSLIIPALFLNAYSASANAENTSEDINDVSAATGFTYSFDFPENQIEDNIGYFKLKLAAAQEQIIMIRLTNLGEEKLTINVGLNGAKTNQNGVIEYGDSAIEDDPSLEFKFTDVVSGPTSVELGPKETKEVPFTIKMPKTGFAGVLAGGIQLMKANQEEAANDSGSKIINQYAYVIGVLIQETEQTLKPDLKLNSVTAGQNNYRNAVFVNFSNVVAAYLDDLTVETQISAKNNSTVLYERKQAAMRMAPNSFLNFPVSMNGEQMVAGTYVAKILVTSGVQKWEWAEEFEITQREATEFNERDVSLIQEKGLDWRLIISIVVGVLVIVILIVGIIQQVKRKKERFRKKAKEKRKLSKNRKRNG